MCSLHELSVSRKNGIHLTVRVIKRWSLTSVQTGLNKIGGRLAFHVRRLVFQLAEVVVTRDMFSEMLEMIGRLRLVPG